jgi:hypothetical protein
VPPIPGTFVVNIGRGEIILLVVISHSEIDPTALEYVTQNILRATTHRVLSPQPGPGMLSMPRYSVAFFQNIGLDVKLADSVLQRMRLAVVVLLLPANYICAVAPEILALKEERVKPTGLSGKEYFLCHRSESPCIPAY